MLPVSIAQTIPWKVLSVVCYIAMGQCLHCAKYIFSSLFWFSFYVPNIICSIPCYFSSLNSCMTNIHAMGIRSPEDFCDHCHKGNLKSHLYTYFVEVCLSERITSIVPHPQKLHVPQVHISEVLNEKSLEFPIFFFINTYACSPSIWNFKLFVLIESYWLAEVWKDVAQEEEVAMDSVKVILIYKPPITTIESYCCDGGIVLCDRGAMVFELATLP